MHMSHNKRATTALKSLAAAGLAATTILSSLSFAPAAFAESNPEPSLQQTKSPIGVNVQGAPLDPTYYGARNVDDNGVNFYGTPRCTGDYLGCGIIVSRSPGANATPFAGEGRYNFVGWARGETRTVYIHSQVWTNAPGHSGGITINSPGVPVQVTRPAQATSPLTAQVTKVNHIAKTAIISGTATPNGTVTIGSKVANVSSSGAWSMTVEGLAVGANSLTATQRFNNAQVDQTVIPITIIEGGTLVGVDQGPVELERGESTQVPFVVENREPRTDAKGTVVLTAPDGATFSEQDTVQGSWRRVGNTAWNASTSIPLTEGRLSNDNTTVTFDADWASERPADQQYRFMVGVTAGDETPEGSSAMEFDFGGTSSTGDFRAQGKTTTTVADSENVAAPTGVVEFSDNVTEKASVSGTGAEGATIDLFNGSTKIGTATVENGEWSTTIDPIGAGTHTIRVQQTLGDDVQNVNVEADYRQAAEFTTADNVQFTGGTLSVSGKSSQGATVKITTGGKQVDEFTVTAADGTFTRELEGVGSGPIVLTMTAASRGGLETSDTLRAESPVKVEDLTVVSHVRGGTFVPGTQAFTGQGTAGTTVTLNPFGFDPRYAAYDVTTTVNQFGEWSINRGLSDTPYPLISFKQTPQSGVVNQLTNYDLKPFKEIGEPGDLMITNFKAGDFFNPGNQVFTGIATPGATVTLNPFGFAPQYAQYNLTTSADTTTGKWEIRRSLGNTVYREFAVKQDPEAEGKVNKIEKITIAATGWVGSPADLTLATTEPTFTPGMVTFSGTATPGTVVTMYPFGDDRYADITTTTVTNAVGNWEIKRNMGNQAFPAVFTQTDAGDKVDRIEHRITPAS
ncbi:hypothetical protein EDF63_0253 [Curtobacterium sp. JUb34]|nr:hypothetical protein EDF63_0253 [Curtobacterium sp. JUb34]